MWIPDVDFYTPAHHTPSRSGTDLRMANHPKPSAKNAQGETSKPFEPSSEIEGIMQPVSRDSFHALLRRVVTQPVRSPAPKAK